MREAGRCASDAAGAAVQAGPGHVLGQVVRLDRGFPLAQTADGALLRCKHATALVKGAGLRAVIGDVVELSAEPDADVTQIVRILPRKNQLVRKDPSERSLPQVLAANFDRVIVAHPLAELNLRRLERELVLAHETGAQVAVVLTKADLAAGDESLTRNEDIVRQVVADGVAVLAVSEHDAESIEAVRALVPKGTVAVLIGRSGVGKSSLVNLLAGRDVRAVAAVRQGDGKGRHTTTGRAMVDVARGGKVVDMPGVRGLGMWDSQAGIDAAFPDIARLAQRCRFRDCRHGDEPGCAVRAAVVAGTVPQARLESYNRLVAENREQKARREEASWSRGKARRGR